jgi:3-phosphoshikimate 1-carboxyvinyltransferase
MSKKKFDVFINKRIPSYTKTIEVDSDKSISIRSFLIGSICQNISTSENVLESLDVKSAISACRKLGVKIEKTKPKCYKIYGNGLGSLHAKKNTVLNFSNSGTLARLLIGILTSTPNIEIKIKGDHSLNKRNMKELIDLMSKFGAIFLPKNKYTFPLKMISSKFPIGIKYKAGVSAQLKSAVLLAGLNSYGNTTIMEQLSSRNHTENILKGNTKTIKFINNGKKIIKIYGKNEIKPVNIKVFGDPSSAAFFTALTLLNDNSALKIKNVGLNPTRVGFYKILKRQGAKIRFVNLKKHNNEVYGDILVKSCKLRAMNVPSSFYSSTTDEYLILFVIAGLTNGISTFNGISDLSNKESSRAYEMKKILNQIGIKCELSKNKIRIYGKGVTNAQNKKIKVGNLGDHRVAMCAFILGALTKANTKIKNFETVFTSSPSFLKIMKNLGAKFEIKK